MAVGGGPFKVLYEHAALQYTGKSGWYCGSPELGLVNMFNAHAKEDANAPAANDPATCQRLYNETLRLISEADPRFQPTTQDSPLEQ